MEKDGRKKVVGCKPLDGPCDDDSCNIDVADAVVVVLIPII